MNKIVAFTMAMFHVGAIAAMFYPTSSRILLATGVWFFGGTCIGVCYHRLLTHRGFKTYLWIEYLLNLPAIVLLQGDPIKWVSSHRKHHKFTEKSGLDPHTPRDGKFWAHMDWLIHPDPELSEDSHLKKWVPDLFRHTFYRAMRYLFWIPTTLWGLGCLALGGVPTLLWGVAVPIVFSWHATWLVNSATHLWGKRRFETSDNSRNNWWVAILTLGEGWHNNHHHDPMRARHGIVWWEVDVNFYTIKFLQTIGLAWGVKI